ncbi:MAG: hypothetical protein R3F33_15915 [Planctomycetota bacterium]
MASISSSTTWCCIGQVWNSVTQALQPLAGGLAHAQPHHRVVGAMALEDRHVRSPRLRSPSRFASQAM